MGGSRYYAIYNIRKNLIRSLFLLIPIIILSFLFFGGFVIDQSLQKGMNNMERRLGADLMIVPEGAKEDAQNLILEGTRESFYLKKSVYQDALSIDGVDKITAQFFLKSLAADCCSNEVEIVFFHPETDFIIQPWISKEYKRELPQDTVVVGDSINIEDGKIKLFGKEYKVAAKMAKTGTSLDNSVYFTFSSLDTVLADAEEKGSFLTESQKNTDVISSIFINIKDGYKTGDILKKIHSSVKGKFEVVYPKQLAESLSLNLKGIYTSTHCIIVVGVVLSMMILLIVNVIITNEKKREIALIRMLGVSKIRAFQLLSEESILVCILGSITGCMVGALFVIPFGTYIGVKLDMPYLGPDLVNVLLLAVITIVISILIGFIASICPAVYISNLEPYIALRKEGE